MAKIKRMVSVSKMSKRSRKAYFASRRGDWNGIVPAMRIIPDKRDSLRQKYQAKDAVI